MDGRRGMELRRVGLRMGVAGGADGSGWVEQGNTRVLATVYGPREVWCVCVCVGGCKRMEKDKWATIVPHDSLHHGHGSSGGLWMRIHS